MTLNPRLVLTHLLAMIVAALLALALAGCDGETERFTPASGTSVLPTTAIPSTTIAPSPVPNAANADAPDGSVDSAMDAAVDAADSRPSTASAAPSVRRSAIALRIEGREPVDAYESFAREDFEELGRVHAFFELRNDTGQDAAATVTFVSPRGLEHGQVELHVPAGARRWRTWAFTRAVVDGPEGMWEVRLKGPAGEVLDVQSFELID